MKWYVVNVNRPPIVANQSLATLEDTPLSFLSASDPDGDPVACSTVQMPAHGTLTLTNCAATYSPNLHYTGQDSFGLKASDGLLESNVGTITMQVAPVDHPPMITAPANQTTKKGQTVSLQIMGSDPDSGDGATFSASGLPPALTIDPLTGLISGVIDNSLIRSLDPATSLLYTVTVAATDRTPSGPGGTYTEADSASAVFNWTVGNVVYSATVQQVSRVTPPPISVTNGDFEWGWLGGWATSGSERVSISPDSYHSQRFSALLGDPLHSCGDGKLGGTAAVKQRITVPRGQATLSFWYRILSQYVGYSEVYHQESDTLKAIIVEDGGNSATVGTFGQAYTPNVSCDTWWDSGWTTASFDLTGYAGRTITLEFLLSLDSIDGDLNTYAYLDDVSVR